ncbi:MAG: AarF/ABC1/UbiB kinase family protein [Planctomycetes bacterium]|jgi:ubiquinone biosynthesis protein|nr:AarF/ABC1/UbiB kinase family protein [Planctomycetota bacterium]
MRAYQFIRLIYEIYGKAKPDLAYIQSLGLLAVKIGQVHALRLDFLSEATCQELAKLYRQTTPLPAEALDALIDSYTDRDWRGHFRLIKPEPIASASVGQVHYAELRDGTPVAIKIIKKNFKATFERDVNRLLRFFRFIILFYPKLRQVADPVGILKHIREYTLDELDLTNEIKGQATLQSIRAKHEGAYDLSDWQTLKYYDELSNENVLVSEFLFEPTLDELLSRGKLPYEELLKLFHLHGFFLFRIGTFHGDIHPGNIVYRQNKKLTFIDNAALGHAGECLRTNLFYFFDHLSQYDYPRAAHYLNQMAEKRIEGQDYEIFLKKFLELYSDFNDKSVSQVSLTKRMMETIKLGVNSGMAFERGMFGIIKSLMYLDGMVLKCRPDAVLLKDMRAFVEEFKRVLKPAADCDKNK